MAGATWSIFDVKIQAHRRSQNLQDFEAKEFVGCAFQHTPTGEKNYLLTLTGAPDWTLIMWKWEKSTIEAVQKIDPIGPVNGEAQISFSPYDPTKIVVTGGGIYKQFLYQDKKFNEHYSAPNVPGQEGSMTFTCHCWSAEGYLVVCTAEGDVIICKDSGEFKLVLEDSPGQGVVINSITAFSRGLVVGGTKGEVFIYTHEKTDDINIPFQRMPVKEDIVIKCERSTNENPGIMSMAVTSTEDMIYLITNNNQLLKLSISLDGTDDECTQENVIYDFHSEAVTGLDICLRKQLIVTCSEDKSIRIWNYATKELEVCKYQNEKCLAVAFHPSGFHIVVALNDKIQFMNVFSNELKTFKSISIKNCIEIQFSNGGHLVACMNLFSIQVFNFWTCHCPEEYNFKIHAGKVKSITWYEDDSGFISSGMDGAVYHWDLKDNNSQNNEWIDKSTTFTSVAKVPEQKTMYVVNTKGQLLEILASEEKAKVETGIALSQVLLSANGKALIVGTGEEGQPGSIQVYKFPFEKVWEV